MGVISHLAEGGKLAGGGGGGGGEWEAEIAISLPSKGQQWGEDLPTQGRIWKLLRLQYRRLLPIQRPRPSFPPPLNI